MREDPADIWMKTTDPDNGRIVCGANWKLYPQRAPPQQKDVEAFWFEGEDRQTAEYFIRDFMGRRQSHTGYPHLFLFLLFTHPDYQGTGAGKMMLRWGSELANLLSLPIWLEASPAGYPLYKQMGFIDIEPTTMPTKKWTIIYTTMTKPIQALNNDVEK